ncbi:MAG: hypothetical protein ACI934_000791 [Pseudohongiellaceae bacterium]|jgi:hypothetical protein
MQENNWIKWSSVAEIVSSVAVLMTLIYLAIQTQQNTITINSVSSQGLQDQITQVLSLPADNEQLMEIIYKGMYEPSKLTDIEAYRFRFTWNIWLNAFQNIYFQDKLKTSILSPNGWYQEFANAYQLPGVKIHWAKNKYVLDPEFVEFAEKYIFTMEASNYSRLVNSE